ncbi:MAG: SRPBCC family protein [Planctomycetota bacterium]
MAHLSLNAMINAPVDQVFALATDLSRAAEYIDGIDQIEILTEGPIGVGTKWRETRTMFGKQATETLDITGFQPPLDVNSPASYTAECESCGCHFVSEFQFHPAAEGTHVELQLTTRPITLFAKLLSPLTALTMGACKKAMEQDLANLKRAAESA